MRAGSGDPADWAARAVERAVAAGAAEAEAYASEEATREVRAHGGEVESLTAATRRGVGVRAWIGARVGYAYGTDLSEAGIAEIGARAAESAAVADEDEFAGPPEEGGEPPVIDGLTDASVVDWPVGKAAELALEIERRALEADPRVVGVEQAVYVDSADRVALSSSKGAEGAFEATSCYGYLQALAEGGDGRETGLGFGMARGPAGLDPGEIGREGAERATSMIGSGKPSSRACPVVLDPTVAASFVGLFGGVLGADAVQRGRSPLAGMVGEAVAGEAFVLSDDGLDPAGIASAPFDGEGVPHRRTALISGGELRTYLYDTYTARRGGAPRPATRAAPDTGRSHRSPPPTSSSSPATSTSPSCSMPPAKGSSSPTSPASTRGSTRSPASSRSAPRAVRSRRAGWGSRCASSRSPATWSRC